MQEKPLWLKYSESEVKSFIIKLADKGITAEKIGLMLRDSYGIPRVRLYKLKIKEVLKEKFQDQTIINLEKKVEKIGNHAIRHKQDKKAARSLMISKTKLKKIRDYHE